jgi:cephalosporin hydroxylase
MDNFYKTRKLLVKRQGQTKNKLKAYNFINFLLETKYVYNFDWMGFPIIQFPSDILVLQEILFKEKPDIVIECGIGRGGSLIFYSSILKLIKKKFKIVGIELSLGKNKKRIKKSPFSKNITLIEGSSTDEITVNKIKKILKNYKKPLIILDSNHTHKHVLDELNIYSKFIKKNGYLIVLDSLIEFINKKHNDPKKGFKKGNSPYTAIIEFLKRNSKFKIDPYFENKALITSAPSGFLKKIK